MNAGDNSAEETSSRRPRAGALLAGLGLAVAGLGFALITTTSTTAQAAEGCEDGGGWVKVDVNQQTYSYTGDVPEGSTVLNCYKAGNAAPVTGEGIYVETTVWNKPECENDPSTNGCSYQDISHASFKVIPPTTTPPESTPPESTPPESTPPESTPPESTPPESTPPASTPPETPVVAPPPSKTPSTSDAPPSDAPPSDAPPSDAPPVTPAGAPPVDDPGVPTRIPAGVSGSTGVQAVPATYEGGSSEATLLGRGLLGLGLGLLGAGGVVGLQRLRGEREG